MCLITEQQKPIRTDKDLVVYKTVIKLYPGVAQSVVTGFNWNIGCEYKTRLKKSKKNVRYANEEVYEKYLKGRTQNISLWRYCKNNGYVVIGEGFHAYTSKKKARKSTYSWNILSIAKCIIPQGSLIYKDKTGLIVSNRMIMDKLIS